MTALALYHPPTKTQLEAHERHKRFIGALSHKAEQPKPEVVHVVAPLGSDPPKVLPPISNEAIRAACELSFPKINAFGPRLEVIQSAVLKEFKTITKADFFSSRRAAEIVLARQVSMYLSKRLTTRSLPEIGRRTGGRDHTTVLHAVRKISARIEKDANFAAFVDGLRAKIAEVSGDV